MIKIPKWFRMAAKEAAKSEYKMKVGAVVVKGGSIIASAHNEVRFRAKGNRWTDFSESLHAERAALSKLNKEEVKGCHLYVYREFNDTGKPAYSKPCKQCSYMIRELGVKKVYFTIPEYPYYTVLKVPSN